MNKHDIITQAYLHHLRELVSLIEVKVQKALSDVAEISLHVNGNGHIYLTDEDALKEYRFDYKVIPTVATRNVYIAAVCPKYKPLTHTASMFLATNEIMEALTALSNVTQEWVAFNTLVENATPSRQSDMYAPITEIAFSPITEVGTSVKAFADNVLANRKTITTNHNYPRTGNRILTDVEFERLVKVLHDSAAKNNKVLHTAGTTDTLFYRRKEDNFGFYVKNMSGHLEAGFMKDCQIHNAIPYSMTGEPISTLSIRVFAGLEYSLSTDSNIFLTQGSTLDVPLLLGKIYHHDPKSTYDLCPDLIDHLFNEPANTLGE